MFSPVAADEVAFAMALFMSAASGQTAFDRTISSPRERRELRNCRRLFLVLSSAEAFDASEKVALTEGKHFRAFLAIWRHYRGDRCRSSVCARTLGFCYLVERSRGTLIERWTTPDPHGPEVVVLHPAVVQAIATVPLERTGVLLESAFLLAMELIVHEYPEQVPAGAADALESVCAGAESGAAQLRSVSAWPAGPGDVAAHMRARDWSETSLGPARSWEQSLRTAVELALACPLPMMVLWGPELVELPNDAYREVMGGQESMLPGHCVDSCRPGVWPITRSACARVLGGEALTFEDQICPSVNIGSLEDSAFDLCYSPLRDNAGSIAGVLLTAFETTGRNRKAPVEEGQFDSLDDDSGEPSPEPAEETGGSCRSIEERPEPDKAPGVPWPAINLRTGIH